MTEDFHADYARAIADAIRYDLREAVDRIEIVGALRRGQQRVMGVTLVYIVRSVIECDQLKQSNLFSGFNKPGSERAVRPIDRILPTLDYLKLRADRRGKLITPNPQSSDYIAAVDQPTGVLVDLFLATLDNWGVLLTLKTGSVQFVAMLKQEAAKNGYQCARNNVLASDKSLVKVPTEEGFFALCGQPWIRPEEREL